jgi:hypothetical protein
MDYYEAGSSGGGDVTGPASSTAGNIAIFDDNTGKVIADSGVDIADVATLPITGFIPTIGTSTDRSFSIWNGTGGTAIQNGTSLTCPATGGILINKAGTVSDTSLQIGTATTGLIGSGGSLSIVAGSNSQISVSATSLTLGNGSSFVTLGRSLRIIRQTTAGDLVASLQSSMYIGVTDTTAPRTITLCNNGNSGQIFIIKDESGGAATNNITVTSTGGTATFDGAGTVVINTNYGVVRLMSGGINLYYII